MILGRGLSVRDIQGFRTVSANNKEDIASEIISKALHTGQKVSGDEFLVVDGPNPNYLESWNRLIELHPEYVKGHSEYRGNVLAPVVKLRGLEETEVSSKALKKETTFTR